MGDSMRLKGPWLKIGALVFTVAILVTIYARVDRGQLLQQLTNLHPGYFGLALFLFVPQIFVTSLRWRVMTAGVRPMSLGESVRVVMAGKALNALVPSKLGEMSKAYFLKRDPRVDTCQAVSVVILEKVLDMGGLCAVLLLGVLISISSTRTPAVWIGAAIAGGALATVAFLLVVRLRGLADVLVKVSPKLEKVGRLVGGWDLVLSGWKRRRGALALIVGLSILLWGLHVLQIYLFFPSLRQDVPVAPVMAFVPLAILVGLMPVTIGGMGTRDSALILLFSPYAGAATMAGVGVLSSMRYWVDTLLGTPFFFRYTRRARATAGRRENPGRQSPDGGDKPAAAQQVPGKRL